MTTAKAQRGSASQFFVAAELCRRGFPASITMGNTAHVDILCSNAECSRFVHVQVKTFVPKPGGTSCQVGLKAEHDYGPSFFWVLCGLPLTADETPDYFVIPTAVMAKNVKGCHRKWLKTPGREGQQHDEANKMRVVYIPPAKNAFSWDISEYAGAWHLIEQALGS